MADYTIPALPSWYNNLTDWAEIEDFRVLREHCSMQNRGCTRFCCRRSAQSWYNISQTGRRACAQVGQCPCPDWAIRTLAFSQSLSDRPARRAGCPRRAISHTKILLVLRSLSCEMPDIKNMVKAPRGLPALLFILPANRVCPAWAQASQV